MGELVVVAEFAFEVIDGGSVGGHRRFQDRFVLRPHVQGEKVGAAVAVEVPGVGPHREVGGMAGEFADGLFERSVALVEVAVVVFREVVADVEVGVAVLVKVGDGGREAVADFGGVEVGGLGDVGEGILNLES